MRYASIIENGMPRAALVDGDTVVPLTGVTELGPDTPIELLRDPPLDRAAARPIADVQLRPVVPRPAKIICVGINYAAHAAETGRTPTDYPVLFPKFASGLIGARDAIPLPPESAAVDYEGELTVVIGRAARRVSVHDALDYVAGYTIANDVSMRDFQSRTPQFLPGKAWDATTPVGPVLVTSDEIPDPAALEIRTTLNGEQVQHAPVSDMIFSVPELIATISQFTELAPGDLILTGTPDGVGMRRDPPRLLQPGDLVAVTIPGIGSLENPVVAERAA